MSGETLQALGPVLSAADCRSRLSGLSHWSGVAVYVLWNRLESVPIYCGTARNKTRLASHLHKDDLANGPVGKTHVNPALRQYCLSQPKGWLGVSFAMFADDQAARAVERTIIAQLGIRKFGGQLFNQRMEG